MAPRSMKYNIQGHISVPENGLVIFYGIEDGVEVGAELEPPFLITQQEYRAQGRFETKVRLLAQEILDNYTYVII